MSNLISGTGTIYLISFISYEEWLTISQCQIYAPWCGHCQALEPTYNKLAKHLRSVNSLVIAKMDGTTNEHPRAKVIFYIGVLVVVNYWIGTSPLDKI